MMIERHYDEEALIALLETNRAATDTHLPSCPPCFSKLESFQMIADAMRDRDVWDTREVRTEAVPATITTLRTFADRMTADDVQADQILPELLAGPRETWMPRLQEHPEWRTAGVVRRLLARAYDAVMTMPPDAVEMTAISTDIAEHLDPGTHPSDTVARLRGAAWRDHAYALYYTGRFTDAESALCASERHLSYCAIDSYELARVGIVKALVLRAFERFDEAMGVTITTRQTFATFEDLDRYASGTLAHVHVLFSRSEYSAAEGLLRDLDRQLAETNYIETHARVLGNLAYAVRKLGKFEEAIQAYDCSAALLDALGVQTESVRLRWNIASTLAEAGQLSAALERLSAVLPEMEELGMSSEAAYNALDIAELLLAQNRFDEVERICRDAIGMFERAGVSYTARALTALAFIREAVQQRRATQVMVRSVREYIHRLPKQPDLLFAAAF